MTNHDLNTCPNCGHGDAHSPMVGCLHNDEGAYCDCTLNWEKPKTLNDAHRERDAAMAQVDENADAAWVESAENTIRTMALSGEHFTPDDVWDFLAAQGIPAPREPRALGPVIKRALTAKTIRALGYTESRRRHGAPVRIYEGTQ